MRIAAFGWVVLNRPSLGRGLTCQVSSVGRLRRSGAQRSERDSKEKFARHREAAGMGTPGKRRDGRGRTLHKPGKPWAPPRAFAQAQGQARAPWRMEPGVPLGEEGIAALGRAIPARAGSCPQQPKRRET